MNPKTIFVTLSSIPKEKIRSLAYKWIDEENLISTETGFPGIALLEKTVKPGDSLKIVLIYQTDKDGYWKENLERFKEDLARIFPEQTPEISEMIEMPMNLRKEHQLALLKRLCAAFEPHSEVYMDIGSGPKTLSIGMFSALSYAERVKKCSVRDIVLGTPTGELYDVRCTYELMMLMRSIDRLPTEQIDTIIDAFEV